MAISVTLNVITQLYCDMSELDGGGWTLVWQHSYMEDLPLNLSMAYFSEDYSAGHHKPPR